MIVNQIERELKDLWSQMAGTEQSHQAVTRACVHNLVIFNSDQRADTEVTSMMADITTENPGRIIVLLPPADQQTELSAWVTAQCHMRSGGRKQVCCEEIMIRTPEEELSKVPSIIRSLLVPDMPVFIWWRAPLGSNRHFLNSLLESADRVVVDSFRRNEDAHATLNHLAALVHKEGDWTRFSDLAWARITSWRHAIAEMVEHHAFKRVADELNSLEVRYHGTEVPTRALLLSAWLGSSLQWKGLRTTATADGFKMTSKSHSIVIGPGSRSSTVSGIESVVLKSKKNRVIAVDESEDSRHLAAKIMQDSQVLAEKLLVLSGSSEPELMNVELEILGRDRMFEKALSWIRQL